MSHRLVNVPVAYFAIGGLPNPTTVKCNVRIAYQMRSIINIIDAVFILPLDLRWHLRLGADFAPFASSILLCTALHLIIFAHRILESRVKKWCLVGFRYLLLSPFALGNFLFRIRRLEWAE